MQDQLLLDRHYMYRARLDNLDNLVAEPVLVVLAELAHLAR